MSNCRIKIIRRSSWPCICVFFTKGTVVHITFESFDSFEGLQACSVTSLVTNLQQLRQKWNYDVGFLVIF